MTKTGLVLLFCWIFICMVWATVAAVSERSLFEALPELWKDAWFRATLLDAYFGFLTVFVWVAYKETRWLPRAGWLAAFLVLGNLAISFYVLAQVVRLRSGEGIESLLTLRNA